MSESDPRPPVWVGHISLTTSRLAESHDFMVSLGMRSIVKGDGFAVLELRAGTHLLLQEGETVEPALHHYHNTYRAALGMPPLELIEG